MQRLNAERGCREHAADDAAAQESECTGPESLQASATLQHDWSAYIAPKARRDLGTGWLMELGAERGIMHHAWSCVLTRADVHNRRKHSPQMKATLASSRVCQSSCSGSARNMQLNHRQAGMASTQLAVAEAAWADSRVPPAIGPIVIRPQTVRAGNQPQWQPSPATLRMLLGQAFHTGRCKRRHRRVCAAAVAVAEPLQT